MEFISLLKKIDQLKKQFDSLKPFDVKQAENLKEFLDIELTYNSNAIEGSTLTYAETKLILNEGITIGDKKLREHLEVINHKEAIDYIETLINKKTHEIKECEILKIHSIILRGIDTANAGRYRNAGVRIAHSKVILPNQMKVPELMTKFFVWLQKSNNIHPVELASEAHYKFVSIHPFINGNGRTARLLMNLILLQKGYPLFTIKIEQRKKYLEVLEKAQLGESLENFNCIIGEAILESLKMHIEAIKKHIYYK